MHLIKSVYYSNSLERIIIEDGIWAQMNGKRIFMNDAFWGETEINGFDSRFKTENQSILVSYTYGFEAFKDYETKNLKRINLYVEEVEMKHNVIHGIITIIQTDFGSDLKTTGKVFFVNAPNEAVVILKEGQKVYLKSNMLEVVNQRLILV